MNPLTEELLEVIYKNLSQIVGDKALKLLRRKAEEEGENNIPKIIFEIAGEMEKLFGSKGAYSVLRELGRTVAHQLMEAYPKEKWQEIFEKGLNIMGFAKGVKKEPTRACICSCIFYPQFLGPKNLKPTEHPVCWIGWGFIEGFMKAFTGAAGVRFTERDYENQACWFEIVNY